MIDFKRWTSPSIVRRKNLGRKFVVGNEFLEKYAFRFCRYKPTHRRKLLNPKQLFEKKCRLKRIFVLRLLDEFAPTTASSKNPSENHHQRKTSP